MMKRPHPAHGLHGLMAEFETPQQIVEAAERARQAGYSRLDAFTPFPIEALSEALGLHKSRVPLLTLIGGLIGAVAGYGLQYWVSAIAYPLNIGGRPYNSWPAFIPVTFETTILIGGLFAVIGMLALNGLPMPHHPVFNVQRFALASRDRYFLLIESRDPRFEVDSAREFLRRLGPVDVYDVEA